MIALASFLAVTAIGFLGAVAVITVAPTLIGVLTSAAILAITVTMGTAAAISLMERARHRDARLDEWSGESE